MYLGVDIGYNEVKSVGDNERVQFPSVTGTPEGASFSLNGNESLVLVKPAHVAIGEAAVLQSRFSNRQEGRDWITTPDYRYLFYAALAQHTTATQATVDVVTGLPIAFYADKDKLTATLRGEHVLQLEGRNAQRLRVDNVRVVPQPFGSLLSVVLDARGGIVDNELALSRVGVIDVGGKTTNLLSVYKLSEVDCESTSVNAGAWQLVRAVREWLATNYPGADDRRDNELAEAIRNGHLNHYGDPIPDFTEAVAGYADSLAQQITSTVSQLWNGGATLDKILVTGGGSLLLGDAIQRQWPHAQVVPSPVYANAIGYHRLARRLFS